MQNQINTSPLSMFVQQVRSAEMTGSKQVSMDIAKARLLALALTELLDKFHDDNPELHKSTLQAGWAFIDNPQSVVDKTKTKIDNALVQGIEDAIVASAKKYGISLPS